MTLTIAIKIFIIAGVILLAIMITTSETKHCIRNLNAIIAFLNGISTPEDPLQQTLLRKR